MSSGAEEDGDIKHLAVGVTGEGVYRLVESDVETESDLGSILDNAGIARGFLVGFGIVFGGNFT